MTEMELIKGCIQEKKACQRELFARFSGKMMSVCMRYARNRAEAEDILQEGFIRVFDNISKFRFQGSFEGWVRRIMVNSALKFYSKKAFKQEFPGIESYHEQSTDPVIYSQLSEQELLNMVAELPDGYRLVFNLYIIEGYSHKEIGKMLKIGESTSRSQLTKARKMLQQKVLASVEKEKIRY